MYMDVFKLTYHLRSVGLFEEPVKSRHSMLESKKNVHSVVKQQSKSCGRMLPAGIADNNRWNVSASDSTSLITSLVDLLCCTGHSRYSLLCETNLLFGRSQEEQLWDTLFLGFMWPIYLEIKHPSIVISIKDLLKGKCWSSCELKGLLFFRWCLTILCNNEDD